MGAAKGWGGGEGGVGSLTCVCVCDTCVTVMCITLCVSV